jgi:hypothetical protein
LTSHGAINYRVLRSNLFELTGFGGVHEVAGVRDQQRRENDLPPSRRPK